MKKSQVPFLIPTSIILFSIFLFFYWKDIQKSFYPKEIQEISQKVKNSDETKDYLSDEEVIEDLRLVFCTENYFNELGAEYFEDILPEDGDLPTELQKAIDNLNEVIKNLPVASYSPSNIRTSYVLVL